MIVRISIVYMFFSNIIKFLIAYDKKLSNFKFLYFHSDYNDFYSIR